MKRLFTNARKAAAAAVVALLGTAILASCGPEKADPVKLATPQPALLSSTETSLTFSWDKVSGAVQYSYTLTASDGTAVDGGTTANTSIEFTGLASSAAYIFSLTAYPEVGSEDYLTSDAATLTANTADIPPVTELWRVTGTFDDGTGNTWDDVLIAYSDGSYTIKDWYNIKGYDFEFVINEDGTIGLTNGTVNEYGNPSIEAGDGMVDIYTGYYEGYAYSGMEGDKESGSLWFSNYRTDADCTLTWPAVEVVPVTMDEIVGTYTQSSTGSEIFNGETWNTFESTNDVTIEKVDDNTVTVTGLMYEEGSVLTAKLDTEAATLTFEPQSWLEYYTFCLYDAQDSPVIAHISNGVIKLNNWTAFYVGDGWTYSYIYSAKSVLTKK